MSSRIMIVELANAPPDELDKEARGIVEQLNERGVERVARYRKLNESLSIVLAEFPEDGGSPANLSFQPKGAGITAKLTTATAQAERRREDTGNDPRDAPILYCVGFPVPDDREAELARWYDEEHMELLQRSSYWAMTRRFRVDPGASSAWGRHLALHYLNDIKGLRSPERDYARHTPWRLELGSESWFKGNYSVYLQELP